MIIDYSDNKYEKPNEWIKEQLNNNTTKEYIINPLLDEGHTIAEFLTIKKIVDKWEINEDEWMSLLDKQFIDQAERKKLKILDEDAVIISTGEKNKYKVPTKPGSSWRKYKELLVSNGLSENTIGNIEKDALSILRSLSSDTRNSGAIKGLVVGSVQSGKTTNMAALMTMAADYGWNVFIVLTGMIDKLREQTDDRLKKELTHSSGNVNWVGLYDLNYQTTQSLNFANANAYYHTTLKNKIRLEQLIDWVSRDSNKMSQMKILIIDDEADQASINTAKIDEEERKSINRLLVNLTSNLDKKGKELNEQIKSINYVGYTATPYANVLNESSEVSLYPKDFISLLSQSKSYIGPTQIFGVEGVDEYPGIDIVNNLNLINPFETSQVKAVHEEDSTVIPQGLKESISYFIAASASLRVHNFGKPLSMLIHTSNRKAHHEALYGSIRDWITSNKNEVLKLVEEVWNVQCRKLNIKIFKESYPLYEQNLDDSYLPHHFNEIEDEVKSILKDLSPIEMDDYNEPIYHNGIHMCIDNSDYNQINDDKHYRLLYPENKNDLEKTPIFLVIGGNTLSRGLTIEGLISTYFFRVASMSDSLMQMGRWFGYRVKYELYPRVWMTEEAINEFEYLSLLDYELREEIKNFNSLNSIPTEVGLRVKTSPYNIKLMLTAKNKQQQAKISEYDFSGASIQTVTFNNDLDEFRYNLEIMESFINDLGEPIILNDKSNRSVFWENVDFETISIFLKKYRFSEHTSISTTLPFLIEWNEKMSEKGRFKKWNVIVVGTGEINEKDNNWILKHFSWNMVERSRYLKESIRDDIRIKALRGTADLYRDIDKSKITDKDLLMRMKSNQSANYIDVREELGMQEIPQLILYRIDRNSKPKKDSIYRGNLDVDEDIAAIYISIPGSKSVSKYATHLTINLQDNNVFDENDLEDE